MLLGCSGVFGCPSGGTLHSVRSGAAGRRAVLGAVAGAEGAMSGEKTTTSPCNKFQANVFNQSKCQNCFKSRELHLLRDRDTEQVKPIYGGWLCLAPEGTDFDNPMQRSRKWQRRFFVLYEDGSLSFALDELPSTLPQGTLNMNLCTDIADAEPRTGQRSALCIVTPEQEIFIRGDNKEIINGWSDQLAVYLRTNRQNQKKKRKVEPVANQEPTPAKMAATDPGLSPSDGGSVESSRWREDRRDEGPDVTPIWTVTTVDPPDSDHRTPAGNTLSYLSPVSTDSPTSDGGFGSLDSAPESTSIQTPAISTQRRRDSRDRSAERMLGLDAIGNEEEGETAASRTGRSEARSNKREKLQSCGDIVQLSAPPPQRRAKSLDRRTSDTVMTPDLLNFKKGWMVKLDENDQWKKYWFVLSTDSLRYYKDSIAEEASDLEGEIDLSKCFNVSEYQVQRNYGFQIHTPRGVFTLSAMTAGIRKNWIQALMRNVHPANAPDVASLPVHHGPPEVLPRPDVTPDSPSTDIPADEEPHPRPRSVTERRREGRYRTFDWAEFRPQNRPDPPRTGSPCSLELGDLERRKRREERRRRYESMLGISLGWEAVGGHAGGGGGIRALSPKSQQRVEEEIEECWRQVERATFRPERTVALVSEDRDDVDVEAMLLSYRRTVEDLKVQLDESEHRRLKLEAQLSPSGCFQQQPEASLCPEADYCSSDENPLTVQPQLRSGSTEVNVQPPSAPQLPSIWLQDADGNLQELEDLLPETAATPLLSSASDISRLSESDGETVGHTSDGRLDREDSSDTQISSFSVEEPVGGDDVSSDQAAVKTLSQEVELLTNQNQALNQRNQEMLNQLTEADREIERLKAELSVRYAEPRLLPEAEQQGDARQEDLERELNCRNRELQEAQTLISSLEENLREAEAVLQLETGGVEVRRGTEKTEGYLLRCFEATEAKLTELEMQLDQSEQSCQELRRQNDELKEAKESQWRRAEEAEADVQRLKEAEESQRRRAEEAEADVQRLNNELKEAEEGQRRRAEEAEADIQRLNNELKEAEEGQRRRAEEAEADVRRLNDELKEARKEGDRRVSGEDEKIQKVMEGTAARLRALEKLLETMDGMEVGKESEEEEEEEGPAVVKQLRWEEELWSLTLNKLKEESSDVSEVVREVMEQMVSEKQILLQGYNLLHEKDKEMSEGEALDMVRNDGSVTETTDNHDVLDLKSFKAATRMKLSLLNQVISPDVRLEDFHLSCPRGIALVHSAATEALYCCRLSRTWSSPRLCHRCVELTKENGELKAELSSLQQQWASFPMVNSSCQTDDICPPDGGTDGMEVQEVKAESEEADRNEELISELRGRAKELEEEVSTLTDEMKEFDMRMSSVQTQYEKEMEKLKATCERGFSSMEQSHLKQVEELQRQHQQQVERLLVERDRLLEEESAATATAIEAIKSSHRMELQREVERRCQSESSSWSSDLEDIHRQHSEELASYQRELEVLSQQFSLKCLENGHLVQALEAERKALCQCQQENQDLRTRNQELSGHLAAEITRLCSLAKQDELPLSQGMDVYEMEITLRVKESEVQCLKQEITSLKDELQSAQKDKRNASKKYKDMYTELSIVRAKAERESEELRENLRLAHEALRPTP